MTPDQRTKASRDLTLSFLGNYYPQWRLAMVAILCKVEAGKYDFFKNEIDYLKQWDDITGEPTIAQEITNGIYFDAISQCVQYIEDLFALINAIRQPDFFSKNIITYKAGVISALIRSYSPSIDQMESDFGVQALSNLRNEENEDYKSGMSSLIRTVEKCTNFYKEYEIYHNQYKHGLAVGFRPFSKILTSEMVEQEKGGKFLTVVNVYDNLELRASVKSGRQRSSDAPILHGTTRNVKPFLEELMNERNYLKLISSSDALRFSMNIYWQMAAITCTLVRCFRNNHISRLSYDTSPKKFILPTEMPMEFQHFTL